MRGHRAHVALTLIAAAIAASGGTAPVRAQTVTSPYIEPNPNVTVDLSVLDGYSGAPAMPHRGYPSGSNAAPGNYAAPGYTSPGVTTGAGNGIPTFLVRPDAPRYAAPPPEVQALIQGRSGSAPSRSMAAVPPSSAPSQPAPRLQPPTPKPAPAQVSQPKPAAPQPTASKPQQTAAAAPTPPPPPPAPSSNSTAKSGSVAAPPPPSVPEPTKSASAAPPPPPPAMPKKDEARQTSAPTVPAPAPAPQPSSQSASGDTTRIAFPQGQSQLPADASAKLDPVISRLKQDDRLRIQLMAYANGDQDGANKARRLSLSRALAVRAYLIDNEIASTRMDVRALGNRSDEGPADRVDLVVINR